MKPQDILVAIKIFSLDGNHITYLELSKSLKMSSAETHAAVRRLKESYLFDTLTNSIRTQALEEFLIHGLHYTYPAMQGKPARGLMTGYSTKFYKNDFSVSKNSEVYVWPFSSGKARGVTIEPLYRTVPEICQKDESLYYWMTLLDMLRLNKAREREVAINHLKKLLKRKGNRRA